MKSLGRTIAATAAAAMLMASSVASAATPSASALSLAGSPAVQDAAAASSEKGNGTATWINIGILAALTAIVLVATGGDDSPSSP